MNLTIPQSIQTIIEETRSALTQEYHNRLKGIILYGSYARGHDTEESDIDLLVVLDRVDSIMEEYQRYFPIVSRLSLEYDMVISMIPCSEKDYQTQNTPLLMNIRKEGFRM